MHKALMALWQNAAGPFFWSKPSSKSNWLNARPHFHQLFEGKKTGFSPSKFFLQIFLNQRFRKKIRPNWQNLPGDGSVFAVLFQAGVPLDLCHANRGKTMPVAQVTMKSTYTLPTASKNITTDNITGLDLIGACITGLDLIGA